MKIERISLVARILALLALFLPSAATAGLRAIYAGNEGSREILIADNGDASVTFWENKRLILRGDQAYVVEQRLTGPIVSRLDDLLAAAGTKVRKKKPAEDRQPALVSRGAQLVNGREGEAFAWAAQPGQPESVVAVLSHDPALAAVGRVFRQLQLAELAIGVFDYGWPAEADSEQQAIIALLARGAALKAQDTSLYRVEPADVPADLTALPAPPETRDALAARLSEEARAETRPSGDDRTMISRAVFAEGRLWLLTDTGKLSSLVEGAEHREKENPGGKVLDLCARRDGLLAVTDGSGQSREWKLLRRRDGRWEEGQRVASNGEKLIALACNVARPVLLTSGRLIELDGQKVQARPLLERFPGTWVKTSVYVTEKSIYVGLNAGEWGGGLRQIDRATGKIVNVERVEGGGPCGGPLDSRCDPVNAVVTIPWKPDCVAAAVGLIHFDASGRILSICDGKVDLMFAQPHDPYQPDHDKAKEAAEGGFGSVAFFGLTSSGSALIAVGDNGLYRIGSEGGATHQPWPLFTKVDGILVSFALPDLILVMTGLNRRASVSGISPLLVIR